LIQVLDVIETDIAVTCRLGGTIVLFVCVDLIDRLLWIKAVPAVAGVFGAILRLAISPHTAFMMNAITLALFIISLEMFKARPAGSHSFHERLGNRSRQR